MHVAANPITNRAAVDYPKYHLRTGADSDVDVFRRSDSKDNFEGYSLGEKVSDDYDNLMIYDSEQVTGSMPNACCSSDGTSDDRECGSRGEEMKNYDVCTVPRAGLDATMKATLATQNQQPMHITLLWMRQPSPQISYVK